MSAQPVPSGAQGEPPEEAAALLLVDRGLDLTNPSTHGSHILDRMVEILPRRDGIPAQQEEATPSKFRQCLLRKPTQSILSIGRVRLLGQTGMLNGRRVEKAV